ncbi:hypothetical protein BCR36DRAFT_361809 [Piromyces finnis]|uniref:Uncharacterized protein n=1 Tax=Piromyces finnis TaxID=1754191 RepID=A0A1Y1UXG2_9FUNG|nr:hypothetical protein BCR36DRAFT_361809 [Piromyces finnis]|eukprot:ORX42823.1 hypothetical protein BCR36DRAFT_361809 [Piromyces finnis]
MNTLIKRNKKKEKKENEDEIQNVSIIGNQTIDSIINVNQFYGDSNKSLMNSLIVMLKKPFHISYHKHSKSLKSTKNKINHKNSQSTISHALSHITIQNNSVFHHNFSEASNIRPITDNFVMDLQSDDKSSEITTEHKIKPKISLEIKQKKSQKGDKRKTRKSHIYQKLNIKKIFKKRKQPIFSSVEIVEAETLPVQKNDTQIVPSSKLSDKAETVKLEEKQDNNSINSKISNNANSANLQPTNTINEETQPTLNPTKLTDPSGIYIDQNKIYSFDSISELPAASDIDPTNSLPTLLEEYSLSSSTVTTKEHITNFDSAKNQNNTLDDEKEKIKNSFNDPLESKLSSVIKKPSQPQIFQDTTSNNTSSIPELLSESNASDIQENEIYPIQANHSINNNLDNISEHSEYDKVSTPISTETINIINDSENKIIINSSMTTDDYPEDDEIRIYCGLPDRSLDTIQSVVKKVSQYFADNVACFWSIFPLNEQHQRMGNWKLGEFIDHWLKSGYEECIQEISQMVSTQDQFLIERLLKFQLKSCSWTSHNNFIQYNLIRICMEKSDEQHINILLRYFIFPPHLWSRIAYFIAELLEFASSIYPDYDVIVSELIDSYDLVHRMNPLQLCLTALYMGVNIVPKHKRPTIFKSDINKELFDNEYTLLELMCCLVVENCMKKYCETEIIKYLICLYAPIVISVTDSKMHLTSFDKSKDISSFFVANCTNSEKMDNSQNPLNKSDSIQFNLSLMKQHLYQSDPSTDNAISNIDICKIDSNDSTLNKNNSVSNINNNNTNNISNSNESKYINISTLNQSHNMSNNLYYNNPFYNKNVAMNKTISTYESSYGGISDNPIGIPMYLLHEQNSFDISNHCIDIDDQSDFENDNSVNIHPSLLQKGNEFEIENVSYQTNDLLSQSISTSFTQSTSLSENKINKSNVNFYLQKSNDPIKVNQSTSFEIHEQKRPIVEVSKNLNDSETDDEKTPILESEVKSTEFESDDLITPTTNKKRPIDSYVGFSANLEGLISEKTTPIIHSNEIVTEAIESNNESTMQEMNGIKTLKKKNSDHPRNANQNDINAYKIKKENDKQKTMETVNPIQAVTVEPLELTELEKITTKITEDSSLTNQNQQIKKQKEDKGIEIPSALIQMVDNGNNDNNDNKNQDDINTSINTSYSERRSFRIKDSLSLSSEYSGLKRSNQSINTINVASSKYSQYPNRTLSRNDSEDKLHQYLSRHSISLYEDIDEANGEIESDFDNNTNYTSLGFINRLNSTPSEVISGFDISDHCPSFYSYSINVGQKGKRPLSIATSMSSSSSSYDEKNDLHHEYSFVSMLSSKPSLSMKSVVNSSNSKVVLREFVSTNANSYRIQRPQGGLIGTISNSLQDIASTQQNISTSESASVEHSIEKSHFINVLSTPSSCQDERQPNDDFIPLTSQKSLNNSDISMNVNNPKKVPPVRTSSLNPLQSFNTSTTDNPHQTINPFSASILLPSESSILNILHNNNHKVNHQIRMEALHDTIQRINPNLPEKWIQALKLVDDYQHRPSIQDNFTDYTMDHLNELEAVLRIFHLYDMKDIQNNIMGWVDSLISKN